MAKAQDTAQLFGKTLYHQGDLSYFEAVNKEALRNALARFTEEGIIQVTKDKESKIGPAVCLALEWMPARDPENGTIVTGGRLWSFIERIAACRREGKNRRDGATVSTRVLTLADRVGAGLFSEAAPDNAGQEAGVILRKPIQRRSRL